MQLMSVAEIGRDISVQELDSLDSSKLIWSFISSRTCCSVGVLPVFGSDKVTSVEEIGREILLVEFGPLIGTDPGKI
jgi:hypothetical protein